MLAVALWVPLTLLLLAVVFTVAAIVAVVTWYQFAVYQTFGIAGALLTTGLAAITSIGAHVGQAFAPRPMGSTQWGSGTNTFCELYVEQRLQIGNQGISAAAAADRMRSLGILHSGEAPAGAIVYFAPSLDNHYWGHVGIADGGGQFTSITYYGLQQYPLQGWQAPYVGWVNPAEVTSDRFGHRIGR